MLPKLRELGFELVIVTSRQFIIADETRKWIARHFPEDMFKEIVFGNHWGLEGRKISKAELCKRVGASILIDDSLTYAADVSESGIKCLLFDLDGKYNWNKSDDELPVGVTRVYNWHEVVETLRDGW